MFSIDKDVFDVLPTLCVGLVVAHNIDNTKDYPAVDGVLDKAGVQALASVPSREELLSKLLYVMQAPVAGFVRGLAALAAQREEAAA